MINAWTAAQILAAERIALARWGQARLMQRAARAVATQVLRRLPSPIPGRRAVLLVGVGNNGGDALFAGAVLRRRGMAVTALVVDRTRVHQGGLAALRRAGGAVLTAGSDADAGLVRRADVVIDGLVGIGAVPPLREPAARLVTLAADATGLRVAVDLPSGVHPDGWDVPGPVFPADLVVTFGGMKSGVALHVPTTCPVVVAGLGIDPSGEPDVVVVTDEDVAALLPADPGNTAHKFNQGVLGVAAGSATYPGAAVLAVGAAVRLRPGLVRYAGTAGDAVIARWPEVVATTGPDGTGRVDAWLVGPGIGLDADETVRHLLDFDGPVLVDADGLTLLARHPDLLARRRGRPTVLTPHAGEFARIFPHLPIQDRLGAVRRAAAETGVTVLLKGDRTVIADGTRTAVNRTGSGWLATAGSGDVLSGVIGSLLAAGVEPFTAAAAGAQLHGRAGERAARFGRAGATALWDHLRG